MAVNKVIYNNNTLIDLTGDTVTASTLSLGVTAHDRSGAMITGTHTDQGQRGVAVVFGDSIFNNGNADPSKASEFGDYLEEQGIFSEVRNFARGGSGFGETYGGASDIEYSLYNMLCVSSNPHYTDVRQAVADAETIYMHLGGNDCVAAAQDGEFDSTFAQKCDAVFAAIFALNPAVTIKYVDPIGSASLLVSKYITDEYGADGAMIFAATRMFIRVAISRAQCNIKIADISGMGGARVRYDGIHPTHDAAFNLYEGIVYGGYSDTSKIVDAVFAYVYGGSYYYDATQIQLYTQLMQAALLDDNTKLLVYYNSPERIECYNMLSIDTAGIIWQGDAGKLIKFDTSGFSTITIGGGGGTSDFDLLTNRPKYNGTAMTHSTNIPEVKTATWDGKQNALVSGTNIKTINGNSILGSGNLSISGGASDFVVTFSTTDGVHFTADKTFAATMAAHNSGSSVIFSIPALGGAYIAPHAFTEYWIFSSAIITPDLSASGSVVFYLAMSIDNSVVFIQTRGIFDTVTDTSSTSVQLKNGNTTRITGTPTSANVTFEAPVSGEDYIAGLIFKAGSGFTFTDTAPTGYSIKWAEEPTWTAGHIYEILYRVLWADNIIAAKYSEVTP